MKRKYPFVIHGNYFGPGNPVTKDYLRTHPPVDRGDKFARTHDLRYDAMGSKAYTHWNKADEAFLRGMTRWHPDTIGGKASKAVGEIAFGVKKLIAPRLDRGEKRSGNRLINNNSKKSKLNPVPPAKPRGSLAMLHSKRMYGATRVAGNLSTPNVVSKVGPYSKYGSFGEDEIYGKISRANAVHFGMSSVKHFGSAQQYKTGTGDTLLYNGPSTIGTCSGTLGYHVAAALLRHILWTEFKYTVERHDQLCIPLQLDTNFTAINHANHDPGPQILFYNKSEQQPIGAAAVPAIPTINMVYRFKFTAKDEAATTNTVKTFSQCARELWSELISHGNVGAVADFSGYVKSIYGYQIITPDALENAATTPRIAAMYGGLRRIDELYINAYSTAVMDMQNITVADNDVGDKNLANRIDANPLHCAIHKFSTPLPRLRFHWRAPQMGATTATAPTGTFGGTGVVPAELDEADMLTNAALQYDWNGDGLILPNVPPTGAFTQLPTARDFHNCSGEGEFSMAPGDIKKVKLHYQFDGKLTNFIKSLQLNNGDSFSYVQANNNSGCGTSILISMEKVMSTGSSTAVDVNYQLCFYAGAYVKKNKRPIMLSYKKDYNSNVSNYGTNAATAGLAEPNPTYQTL